MEDGLIFPYRMYRQRGDGAMEGTPGDGIPG